TSFPNNISVSCTNPSLDAIANDGSTACALSTSGTASCWGDNTFGQLGAGPLGGSSPTPLSVAGGMSFTKISVNAGTACGLSADGSAFCWGRGVAGQLGNGSNSNSGMPVPVSGGLHFRELTGGNGFTCGLLAAAPGTESAAYCWGMVGLANSGQLG